MIIADVNVSFPYIKYTVRVAHFTARKSTAIEWVILEAIANATKIPTYESVPVASLFEQIFRIADADLIIRPCLLSLQDMEAIEAINISDDTELSTVPMRNLRLTDKGAAMHKDGFLPGTLDNDTVIIYYDPIKNALLEATEVKCKSDATGIMAQDLDSIESTSFPLSLIRNFLNKKQSGDTQVSRFQWLMPTTRIDNITNAGTSVLWKNISKRFFLTRNMNCTLDGIDDPRVNILALESLSAKTDISTDNIPLVTFENPDDAIKEILRIEDIKSRILSNLKSTEACVVTSYFFTDSAFRQVRKPKSLKTAIVVRAGSFSVDMQGNALAIYVPDDLLDPGVAYLSSSESIHVGLFSLKVQTHQRNIEFAYIPTAAPSPIADIYMHIGDVYGQKDYRVLFLLYEIGRRDLFLANVNKLLGKQHGVAERAELIDKFNQTSIQVYNQKCLSPEFVKEALIDEEYILSECTDILSLIDVLNRYEKVQYFMQQEELYKALLQCALPHIDIPDHVSIVWSLWMHIQSVKKAHMTWIGQSGLYRSLYSDQLIKEILGNFTSEQDLGEFTPVEQTVNRLKHILSRMKEKVPEVDFEMDISNESVRVAILHHKDILASINEEIRNWNEELNKFETKVCSIESVDLCNSGFSKAISVMTHIADAVSVFFDDSAVKFSKLYIADTCALMHSTELISEFEDGKAMLIIPQTVLSELDGLKNSSNEDEAYHARDVIRTINNYHSFAWINLREASHPELLSSDIGDPQQADNKILSVAIKYIVKQPILLTDDTNLRNKASALGIDSMNLHGFEMSKVHAENTTSTKRKKKKH